MIFVFLLKVIYGTLVCTSSVDIEKCLSGNVRYLHRAEKEVEKLKWEVINEKIPMYHKRLFEFKTLLDDKIMVLTNLGLNFSDLIEDGQSQLMISNKWVTDLTKLDKSIIDFETTIKKMNNRLTDNFVPKIEKQAELINDGKVTFQRVSARHEKRMSTISDKIKKFKRDMKGMLEKSNVPDRLDDIEYRITEVNEILITAKETILHQLADQNMEYQENVILSGERHRNYQDHLNILTVKAFESSVECNQTSNAFDDNTRDMEGFLHAAEDIYKTTEKIHGNAADLFKRINIGVNIIREELNMFPQDNFKASEIVETRRERLLLVDDKIKEFTALSSQAVDGHIPPSFRLGSDLENLNSELGVLEKDISSMMDMADEIDEVRKTLTPNIVAKIQQTSNTLSEIAIENLQRQATNKDEIDLLVSEIVSAKEFLNNTMDRIKYSRGPGLTWDEPIDVTDGTMVNYNYNTGGIVKEVSKMKNAIGDEELRQAEMRELIVRVSLTEKDIEELIQKSIVTNDVNKLFEVINEATAEIAVMRLELTDMTEKLTNQKETYKYERSNQSYLVNLAVTKINEAHVHQERKLNIIRVQIEKKIKNLNSKLNYQEEMVTNLDFEETETELERINEEIQHITKENNQMKSKIATIDLSLDPLRQFAGNDPDDAIRRLCKTLMIEHNLITVN